MKGRLYFILNGGRLDITTDVEYLGDGRYAYVRDGEYCIATKDTIYLFKDEELELLLSYVWRVRIDPSEENCGAFQDGYFVPIHKGLLVNDREAFHRLRVRSLRNG